MDELVSVLSPVHNEARYLQEMTESLQRQTHANWECLLVDDGSTDSTPGICTDLQQMDQRFRVIGDGGKKGKVAAFNDAFAASRGDWIVLLAGDDRLPQNSLERRLDALSSSPQRAVGYFKLRTFSWDKRHDGLVLPRGDRSSRSGGVMCFDRELADLLFPIPEYLVSEDLWLAAMADGLASAVVRSQHIVLEYRIHERNSNPRWSSFKAMTEQMARRHEAWKAVLTCHGRDLDPSVVARLRALWSAELARREGRVLSVLGARGLPIADRLALASMSNPLMFSLRKRLFRLLSGRR